MPEKIVGLNRNVQVTVTSGAGRGCCWESLTFHRNACPPSSLSEQPACSVCLLEHGEAGRAKDMLSELQTGEKKKERTRGREDAGSTQLGKWNRKSPL